jgi:hypothetical protein
MDCRCQCRDRVSQFASISAFPRRMTGMNRGYDFGSGTSVYLYSSVDSVGQETCGIFQELVELITMPPSVFWVLWSDRGNRPIIVGHQRSARLNVAHDLAKLDTLSSGETIMMEGRAGGRSQKMVMSRLQSAARRCRQFAC